MKYRSLKENNFVNKIWQHSTGGKSANITKPARANNV